MIVVLIVQGPRYVSDFSDILGMFGYVFLIKYYTVEYVTKLNTVRLGN